MDSREEDRLWSQREHLNNDFNQFSNYFLLAESILLAVVAAGFSTKNVVAEGALVSIGIALTVVWVYVQSKQKYLLDLLKAKCEEVFEDYRRTRSQRQHQYWRFSNTAILSYVMPSLFAAAWLALAVGAMM